MVEAAPPLLHGLLDDIVLWEIFVRLDPKSLLRCRAVRRAWRCATSTRRFLLAHHARQPALPILSRDRRTNFVHILTFDHRAAMFHTVARLDEPFSLETSCDGLLLSRSYRKSAMPSATLHSGSRLTVYNPATREHASLGVLPWDFNILGMYPHHPTGEYRLLLTNFRVPEYQIGCHVLTLGSDQPPRYIGWLEMVKTLLFETPALFRDSLHWFLMKYRKHVLVFDTMAESFGHMHAPVVLGGRDPGLFEMDGTLGIHSLHDDTEIVNIWVLQDYKSEVWDFKYRIKLPLAEIREQFEDDKIREQFEDDEIREQFEDDDESWFMGIVSVDSGALLLINFGGWLLQVDSDGKLIRSFGCGHRDLCWYGYRLKQSLVQHTFFPALKSSALSASPLI